LTDKPSLSRRSSNWYKPEKPAPTTKASTDKGEEGTGGWLFFIGGFQNDSLIQAGSVAPIQKMRER
jgi:hypothetical protein